MASPEILIVANRLPVMRKPGVRGVQSLVPAPGGLVSALAPVASNLNCVWLGVLDGETHETQFEVDGMRLVTVAPEAHRYRDYYEGFANQVLWPVFHGLPDYVSDEYVPAEHVAADTALAAGPAHASWHRAYGDVNRQFAKRIADTAGVGALVWLHDYHLLQVPAMLRELRPDLRIAMFLHIPFPEPAELAAFPWAKELLAGLSEADVIGVQRQVDAERMREALPTTSAQIRPLPISIDARSYEARAHAALVSGRPAAIRARYGAERRTLFLSVDRLDYTKGITERLEAFEELLADWSDPSLRPTLVQVLTPTREAVPAYRKYDADVRSLVHRINSRFGGGNDGAAGYTPVVTLRDPHDAQDLVDLYLACDVMCVTPLRDGMNLVAKEFVVSRVDNSGVLVLGREAGAADQLTDAVLVNPRDRASMVDSLRRAAEMQIAEKRERMRRLRGVVSENDVHAWAGSFIDVLMLNEM